MPKHCKAKIRNQLGRTQTHGEQERKPKSSPGAGQVPLGTHRQHGIEEVSDEGCSVLHSLLGLGQISH